MKHNMFEELQTKKRQLLEFATKAVEFGWIPKTKALAGDRNVISLEEIKDKLENDVLTIGVIGQMKCGKSTFLNAFVFKDDILPAATTPMTAALSVITYGEKKRIVAEFYTSDEWAEQSMQAKRDESEATDSLDLSKIKAAKELVAKSVKLGSSLNSYLGKTKEDSFEQLVEYVGAEGKYVSITKSVKIYYPHDYLKGVEIVDTPGFNDPIVSREERTKAFLAKADVVVMMLYAGRPFDATDRDIIFKNVRQCGIGKVLVGINKYDIPYCDVTNPEDENQIKEYVTQEIKKACRECDDNTLVEILKEVEPIPLSAEMALLSELPMSRIASKEALNFSWQRHCSNFGISTQTEMYERSRMDTFVQAVQQIIDNEKGKILFAKPLNAIVAAGEKLKADNEKEISLLRNQINLLSVPDFELDEREESLSKLHRRMSKKLDSLGEELYSTIQNLKRKGAQELEDDVDASCKRMEGIVRNEWGIFKGFKSIKPKLDAEYQRLYNRKLKRTAQSLSDKGERELGKCVDEFFGEAETLLLRYLKDFNSRDFVKGVKAKIKGLESVNNSLFSCSSGGDDDTDSILAAFISGLTLSLSNKIFNILSHGDNVNDLLVNINSISNDFDPTPFLEHAFGNKDKVLEFIRKSFFDELIEPLQQQLVEVKTKKDDKAKMLSEAQAKVADLELKKKNISTQVEVILGLKSSLL
ncbi:MAG: dynamin family protein [Porphyromonas sp.]|nr:dynamin family protein [Porphyromonas sp.]